MRTYTDVEDGKWYWIDRYVRSQCCDCGLIHIFEIKKEKGKTYLRMFRDNRATGQVRRYKKLDKIKK